MFSGTMIVPGIAFGAALVWAPGHQEEASRSRGPIAS
jgi:hypothetical protein